MLCYSIISIIIMIPVLYVFGVHIYVKKKKKHSIIMNIKFMIFVSTLVLDILLIFYSTIEPPHTSNWKNYNIVGVNIIDGACFYLIGFFIIKKAGNKHGNKHEWMLSLKVIWSCSLIIGISSLVNLILSTFKKRESSECEIFNRSKE